jgi:hypothetical protein
MHRFKFIPFLRINPFFAVGWTDRNLGVYVGFSGRKTLPVIKNDGWHFTKMFSAEIILESVYASSHTEFRADVNGIDDILHKRSSNKTYYGGEAVEKVIAIDENFPKYLVNNKESFKEFIIPE